MKYTKYIVNIYKLVIGKYNKCLSTTNDYNGLSVETGKTRG